jgi:hypothetical protein
MTEARNLTLIASLRRSEYQTGTNRCAEDAKKNLPLNMAESRTRHEFIRVYNELADCSGMTS